MGMHAFIQRISTDELRDFLALARPAAEAKLPPGVSEEDFRVELRQQLSRIRSIRIGSHDHSPEHIDKTLRNVDAWHEVVAKCIAKLPPGVSEEDFDRQLRQKLSTALSSSAGGNSPERIDRILGIADLWKTLVARSTASFYEAINKEAVEAFLAERAGSALPLEKTFHALHWLITGQVWGGELPLANAVCGGKEYGPDIGYGRVRCLEPREVSDVATALAGLDWSTLSSRWDTKAMRKDRIYAVADKEGKRECALRYPQLQQYYARAADGGGAMLSYIL